MYMQVEPSWNRLLKYQQQTSDMQLEICNTLLSVLSTKLSMGKHLRHLQPLVEGHEVEQTFQAAWTFCVEPLVLRYCSGKCYHQCRRE
jgi:hypothetical protein